MIEFQLWMRNIVDHSWIMIGFFESWQEADQEVKKKYPGHEFRIVQVDLKGILWKTT